MTPDNGRTSGHVVLLGDSIFDNGAYVRAGEPDVVAQLRADLPAGWRASLAAIDGAVTADVARQLSSVPSDASHLVVSVGGNDALRASGVIEERLGSMAEALARLDGIREAFARAYEAMLAALLAAGKPAAVCTVYDPSYPDPRRQRLAVTALAAINDVILRLAIGRGLPVIDLRLVSNEPADYANPIEPSARGGEKIAASIASLVLNHDFAAGRTAVFR
ncbi:MAG TPA: SGNH/GDSL hydrolase family protein [Beijerinckiaceae bacterium]